MINRKYDILLSFLCIVLCVLFIILIISSKKPVVIEYIQSSEINYQVGIEDNDYYEDIILPSGKQYITSLINTIYVDFNSIYSYSEKVDISSNYTVDVIASINDSNTEKEIYAYKETLLLSNTTNNKNKEQVITNGSFEIDYNKYDEIIRSFIIDYDLENVDCTLEINIKIDLKGIKNTNFNNYSDSSQMSLSMPLNKDTIDIEDSIDSTSSDNKQFGYYNKNNNIKYYMIGILICVLVLLIILIRNFNELLTLIKSILYKFKDDNNKENKKILKEYGMFIHKVNKFSFSKYKCLILENMDNLIDIKDTLNRPILMCINSQKETCFFIIGDNQILYMYKISNKEY